MDYPRPQARFGWDDEEEERNWYGPWEEPIYPGSTRRKKGSGGEARETAPHLLLLVLVWVVLYLVLRYLGGGE